MIRNSSISKGLFTTHDLNWTELNWTDLTDLNKSTQLGNTFVCHARRRHDYTSYWLAAVKLGRIILGKFSTQVFQCWCSHWSSLIAVRKLQFSSVQFVCCEHALKLSDFVTLMLCKFYCFSLRIQPPLTLFRVSLVYIVNCILRATRKRLNGPLLLINKLTKINKMV